MHAQIRSEIAQIKFEAEEDLALYSQIEKRDNVLKEVLNKYEKLFTTHRTHMSVEALATMIQTSVALSVLPFCI